MFFLVSFPLDIPLWSASFSLVLLVADRLFIGRSFISSISLCFMCFDFPRTLRLPTRALVRLPVFLTSGLHLGQIFLTRSIISYSRPCILEEVYVGVAVTSFLKTTSLDRECRSPRIELIVLMWWPTCRSLSVCPPAPFSMLYFTAASVRGGLLLAAWILPATFPALPLPYPTCLDPLWLRNLFSSFQLVGCYLLRRPCRFVATVNCSVRGFPSS